MLYNTLGIEERKNYEVTQFKAKTQKTMADAQPYENAKLVTTDLLTKNEQNGSIKPLYI
ncbi:hypothetical protein [Aquimarina longa]|uniref:hypothetical protein n=1 Tax=Aquimarina longa TaxID=1080221 RepID=UPI00130DA6B4|nr:hypothetical protein [Aquimarina longa]